MKSYGISYWLALYMTAILIVVCVVFFGLMLASALANYQSVGLEGLLLILVPAVMIAAIMPAWAVTRALRQPTRKVAVLAGLTFLIETVVLQNLLIQSAHLDGASWPDGLATIVAVFVIIVYTGLFFSLKKQPTV